MDSAGLEYEVPLLQVPVRPTRLSSELLVEPSRTYDEFAEITPSATPVFVSEVEPSVSTDMPTSQVPKGHAKGALWLLTNCVKCIKLNYMFVYY